MAKPSVHLDFFFFFFFFTLAFRRFNSERMFESNECQCDGSVFRESATSLAMTRFDEHETKIVFVRSVAHLFVSEKVLYRTKEKEKIQVILQ